MSTSTERRRRWRPTPDTALALLALAVAAGGGGYALGAITAGSTITACMDAASGQPTKIITTGSCAPGETSRAWDQSGPVGPQGPQGPAGKDGAAPQIVVAGPSARHVVSAGYFQVKIALGSPGWYQLNGHVEWQHVRRVTDVPVHCSINRLTPFQTLDTYSTTVLKDDIFDTGGVDEQAYVLVDAPTPAPAPSGGVVAPAQPVTVNFKCKAVAPNGTSPDSHIRFRDRTLTATPVAKQ